MNPHTLTVSPLGRGDFGLHPFHLGLAPYRLATFALAPTKSSIEPVSVTE
jgi:hypothetical protein